MRFRLQQQLGVGVLLAALVLVAPPAFGLSAAWDHISVTLHGVGSATGPTLIVRGTLDPAVDLPTVAELPVPADARLRWVGEVRGGSQLNDTVASFKTRPGAGCSLLDITTQHARTVQAEMEPPAGWLTAGQQGTLVTMDWTATKPVDHVRLAFEVDGDLHAELLRPITAKTMLNGDETIYAIDAQAVDAGDVLTLTAMVVSGAEPTTVTARDVASGSESDLAGTPHSTSPLLLAVGALAVAAVVVALVFAFGRRGADRSGPGDTTA